jgi:multidrug efflux pump subunit AcrA (membrane-fusion protein)
MIRKRLERPSPRTLVIGVAVLLVVALLLAVRPAARRPAGTDEPIRRIGRGDFQSKVILTGSLAALRAEEFKVPITETWRVQIKWMVKEGETVKPGDPVVRFDTASLAASIETAQDALKAKLEERAQKEDEFENQAYELDVEVKTSENDNRQKSLDASIPEGIESKYEYDRKQLEKKISDQSLASARTKRSVKGAEMQSQLKTLAIEAAELEAKLAKLRRSLDELTLVAGTEGAVIYGVDEWSGRKVQVGDTVFATYQVATIPDLSSLVVQAYLGEAHVQRVQAGQSVDLTLDAYPDRLFHGTIREVSKSADPVRRWGRSSYFRVDIEIQELAPDIMKPGMSVRCEVKGSAGQDVLLVPLEMTGYDGRSFWVRPAGGPPVRIAAFDHDDLLVAARPEDNPTLKAGLILAPVGPLREAEAKTEAKPEEKADETKK